MALQIKKFQAATLQEAIEQIRQELGDDAIILQTEQLRGKAGLFGGAKIEVTAALDRDEAPAPRFHATVSDDGQEAPAPTSSGRGFMGLLKGKAPKKVNPPKVASPAPKGVKAYQSAAKPMPVESKPEVQSPSTFTQPSLGQMYAVKTYVDPLKNEIDALRKEIRKEAPKPKNFKDPLEEEVQSLRSELRQFMNERRYAGHKLPRYLQQLSQYWKEKGVGEKEIFSLFEKLESWSDREDGIESDMAENMTRILGGLIQEANVYQKKQQRIVVLVGPTGAGKTTTIAKMAAYEKIHLGRTVSFITVDDFKIGGTDQLAHYARILEVPFSKSRTDLSLEEQCRVQKADTIFIDTFGISPKDTSRFAALKKLLTFVDPELAAKLEIHLVMPVGMSAQDIHDQVDSYASLKPQFMIFTKWDETDNWGGMLTAILAAKKPVSFISHGQSVPDDFALFSKRVFIETVTEVTGK